MQRKEKLYMNFDKLKGKMKEKHISQEEMAQKIGITQQSFNQKINAKRQFTIEEAIIISIVLSLENPLEYFFNQKIPYMQQCMAQKEGEGMTEIEKVKAFAQEILEQCQDKGFTFSEVKALPGIQNGLCFFY